MTRDHESDTGDAQGADLSLLPEPDLGVRVLPAQYARMLNVSRQTVSRWVQQGRVLLDPSGRLDPVKSTERVLQHSDPARLRATLLKPVIDDMAGLRTELREARERAEAAEDRAERAAARADEAEKDVTMVEAAGDRFIASVSAHLDDLAALADPDAVRAALDDMYMDAMESACDAQSVDTDDGDSWTEVVDSAPYAGTPERPAPETGDPGTSLVEGGGESPL